MLKCRKDEENGISETGKHQQPVVFGRGIVKGYYWQQRLRVD